LERKMIMDVNDLEKIVNQNYLNHENKMNEMQQQIIVLKEHQSGVTISLQWISTTLEKLESGINKKFDVVDECFKELQTKVDELIQNPKKQWDSMKITIISSVISAVLVTAVLSAMNMVKTFK
jgi:hypothetical protein